MADKQVNFKIKFDNKELDLTKVSFEQFDSIIKKAKTDLSNLKVGSPEYKKAQGDINNLESSWKKLIKTQQQEDEQTKKNTNDVKSYTTEIKKLTLANRELELQGQKNSQAYKDNQAKIKSLRDEQEAMQRSTQKLDDALSNIPGPIGKIGSSMQQLESVSGSAKSAMDSLGLGFDNFDKGIKTSLVGFLVGLLVTLVFAVMDAAKSFQPLQDAFAQIKDAVGGLFEAIKPLTDFILNVFVGAVKVVAGIINFFSEGIAKLSGNIDEVNNKKILNQQVLQLERDMKKINDLLENSTAFLSKYQQDQLKLKNDYYAKIVAIDKDETISQRQRDIKKLKIQENYNIQSKILEAQHLKDMRDAKVNLDTQVDLLNASTIKNDRERQRKTTQIQIEGQRQLFLSQFLAYQKELKALQDHKGELSKEEKSRKEELLTLISQSAKLQYTQIQTGNKLLANQETEFARDDRRMISDNQLKKQELTDSLIKKEVDRNVKITEDAKKTLENNHLNELEDIKLKQGQKSQVYKSAVERQGEEIKVADENIRKAKLEQSGQEIQDEINKNNRLVQETTVGTEQYFQAKRKIIELSYKKETLLADGDRQKVLDAQTNQYVALRELDKEQLDQRILLQQTYLTTLYEGTDKYYQAQRTLENLNYQKALKDAEGNYELLKLLKEQHVKNMELIDNSQLQNSATLAQRHADTLNQYTMEYWDGQRDAEDKAYADALKAAGDNDAQKIILKEEHLRKVKELNKQEIAAYGQVASAVLDSISSLGNALASSYDEEAKTSESAFNKRKQLQLATAKMSAASGIIQILTQPSTLPSPADWIVKGLNVAALLIATKTNIDKINSTQFQGGGTTSGGGIMTKQGMADGGYIDGPRHSQGGVNINAEGGEAVMTRGAVSMFGPMLSMMNQMGGGVGFNMGNIQGIRPDNPKGSNSVEQPIIKTYVVEGELTSTQQKNSRLKDLSTL